MHSWTPTNIMGCFCKKNQLTSWAFASHSLLSLPEGDRVNLTTQNQMCGGKNSQFHRYGAEFPLNNCHSWREDFTLCSVLDVFYDTKDKKARAFVKKYVEENDNHMTGKYKGTGDFLELLSCIWLSTYEQQILWNSNFNLKCRQVFLAFFDTNTHSWHFLVYFDLSWKLLPCKKANM